MIWLVIVPLIVLWAIIQQNIIKTTGHMPQSRGSLRYQRSKARKQGIDPEIVEISPHLAPVDDYAEIQRKVNRVGRWLMVPVIAFWVAVLEPWKWF